MTTSALALAERSGRAVATLLVLAGLAGAQELPKGADSPAATAAELFNAPPLVLEAGEVPPGPVSATAVEKARLERDRAVARSARWQRLQRSGVLSKVEAERAQRQASQASMRYEQQHAAQLRQQLAALRERAAAPELIVSAEAALRTAETLAADAEAAWRKLEAALAEVNAERRRALARRK